MIEKSKRFVELADKIWADTATIEEKNEFDKLYARYDAEKAGIKKRVSTEMKNRRRRGKYGEKKVSKELGMKRIGGVGMRDVGDSMFSIEVKTTRKIPASVDKILAQARRLAKKGTIAIGAFRCGRRTVYIIEGIDFVSLHGKN